MDTIFIFKCTLIGQEKIFLLIKSEITRVTTSIGTSMNRRNQVLHLGLHHLNPPSLDSKLTKKRQAWEEYYVLQGTKGCRLKYKQTEATMDYSLFSLQFLLFNVSNGFLI